MTEWIDVNENLKLRIEVQLVQFSKDGKKYNLFTDDFLNFLRIDKDTITIPEVSANGFLTLNREDFEDCNIYYSIFEKRKEEVLASLEEKKSENLKRNNLENFKRYIIGNFPRHKRETFLLFMEKTMMKLKTKMMKSI